MVKLGDPTTKVVEFAEKLKLYMMTMDPTEVMEASTMKHASEKVLKMRSIPVMYYEANI